MKKFEGYVNGVDFGGWLSQCYNYTTDHYNEFIKKEDFKAVKCWGADHVRLPVDYQLVQNLDGTFIEEGFGYIQKAIDWAGENDLNLILDLHKSIGFSFDADSSKNCFFDDEKLQEYFYNLWIEFAKRYSKYENRLCFELLNEVTSPSYSDNWNKIIKTVITKIREIAPTIKILVGGYWNNSIDALKDLDKPFDENIVYNFHCYEPFVFTHQGAGWLAGMPLDFHQKYPCTYGEYNAACKSIGYTDFVARNVPDNGTFDKNYFIERFKSGLKICEERDVPLYCGEYGVINKADPEMSLAWFKDINQAFTELGIGRAVWNYKMMDFGWIDEHMKPIFPDLVKLL